MTNELPLGVPSLACASSASAGTACPSRESHSTDVLLIEPNPDCADALSAILGSLPRIDDVQVVEDVDAAVGAIQGGPYPPAIILVDDQPDSTEILGAVELLGRLAPKSALVLLCVYPQCVDRRVRERVHGCVSKDVNRHELARIVDDVLDSAA